MTKLCQIIAIEKEVKSRTYSEVSSLHKLVQKPDLFNGLSRRYQPLRDDGEKFPAEDRRVQLVAGDVLKKIASLMAEHFDVEATKDWGNCEAKADVIVDGKTLIEGAPTTFLLYLEKQINDIRTILEQIPTLDPAEDWKVDGAVGVFKTPPAQTHKTKKVQKAIVLYDATPEHPAQTQLITEDETVGNWDQIKMSGALTPAEKEKLLNRVNALSKGVKFAREEANGTEVERVMVGETIFSYLFKD